ncbi:MAG TPA: PASTA domain-containing protein [Gemmatimonadales bacterium]
MTSPFRFRRHTPPPGEPSPGRRRLVRDLAIIAVVAVAAFVGAVLWLAPVPIFRKEQVVPRLLGLGLDSARQQLAARGYRVETAEAREHPAARRGTVVWQDPPPETALPAGAVVTLTPSAGAMQVPVPELSGVEMRQAAKILAAAGFRLGGVDTVIDRQRETGMVLGTRPPAGSVRSPGEEIELIVNGASR